MRKGEHGMGVNFCPILFGQLKQIVCHFKANNLRLCLQGKVYLDYMVEKKEETIEQCF